MPIVIAVTLVFALMLFAFGRIGRITGAVMALAYLGFTALQYSGAAETLIATL